jgi:hypothetical protein
MEPLPCAFRVQNATSPVRTVLDAGRRSVRSLLDVPGFGVIDVPSDWADDVWTNLNDPAAWDAWSARYDATWGPAYGQLHLQFPPLFGHQYSHLWVDFRQIRDPFMAAHGLDYFENSRRATYAQRAYAVANPDGWVGYGADVWGLTASDGPGDKAQRQGGQETTKVHRTSIPQAPGPTWQ